jgi:hypothetical protein
VTVRKAGNTYNFPRRVPLPEVYSSICENSCVAYINETTNARLTLTCGGVQVDVAVVLSDPVIWRVC